MMYWPTKKLGDLCHIELGKTPARSNKTLWDESRSSRNIWLSIADIPSSIKPILIDSKEYISDKGAKLCKLVPKGTLLVSFKLSLGRLAYSGCDLFTNEAIAALYVKNKEELHQDYLYWYLIYFDWDAAAGNDIKIKGKTLNKTKLKNIDMLLPLIKEQKHIVTLLDQMFSDVDKARACAEKNLKNARDLFEGYLQQIFSQQAKDWKKLSLSDVSLEFGRGKSKHRPRNDPLLYGGKYPFIQTGDVRSCEHLITSYSKTYNEKGIAQSKLWPRGTICITIAANIAETGIMDLNGCFPDSIIGLVINPEKAKTRYVEYLLQSFKTVLRAKGKGSAQDNINLGTFEKMTFPFPTLQKQQEIISTLDRLMTAVQKLEAIYLHKLGKFEALKKSILQKAFTGKLTSRKEIAA